MKRKSNDACGLFIGLCVARGFKQCVVHRNASSHGANDASATSAHPQRLCMNWAMESTTGSKWSRRCGASQNYCLKNEPKLSRSFGAEANADRASGSRGGARRTAFLAFSGFVRAADFAGTATDRVAFFTTPGLATRSYQRLVSEPASLAAVMSMTRILRMSLD